MTSPKSDLLYTKEWKKGENNSLRNWSRQRSDKQNEFYYILFI